MGRAPPSARREVSGARGLGAAPRQPRQALTPSSISTQSAPPAAASCSCVSAVTSPVTKSTRSATPAASASRRPLWTCVAGNVWLRVGAGAPGFANAASARGRGCVRVPPLPAAEGAGLRTRPRLAGAMGAGATPPRGAHQAAFAGDASTTVALAAPRAASATALVPLEPSRLVMRLPALCGAEGGGAHTWHLTLTRAAGLRQEAAIASNPAPFPNTQNHA
jgi:hypothetical protein